MREEVFPAVPADTKPADRAHLPCVGDETKRGFAASADLAEVIPLAQDTVHPQVVQLLLHLAGVTNHKFFKNQKNEQLSQGINK